MLTAVGGITGVAVRVSVTADFTPAGGQWLRAGPLLHQSRLRNSLPRNATHGKLKSIECREGGTPKVGFRKKQLAPQRGFLSAQSPGAPSASKLCQFLDRATDGIEGRYEFRPFARDGELVKRLNFLDRGAVINL